MCLRVDVGRPIAHVAAEAGISRRCLSKWYAQWRTHDESGQLGADHFTRRDPERAMRRMLKEANSLGLTIRFEPITA